MQFIVAALLAVFFSYLVYRILKQTLSRDLDRIVRNASAVRRFQRARTDTTYESISMSEES